MACGGGCVTENGKEAVDKLRMMGYSKAPLPDKVEIECVECGMPIVLETCEDACPHCCMVYGVTPCHAGDPNAIQPAGINY